MYVDTVGHDHRLITPSKPLYSNEYSRTLDWTEFNVYGNGARTDFEGDPKAVLHRLARLPETQRAKVATGRGIGVIHAPLYYVAGGAVDFALGPKAMPTRLFWVRMVSGLFGVLAVYATWLLASLFFAAEAAALAAAVIVAVQPMLGYLSGLVNNDTAVVSTSMLVLAFSVFVAKQRPRVAHGIWLGGALAVALATKSTALAMMPVAGVRLPAAGPDPRAVARDRALARVGDRHPARGDRVVVHPLEAALGDVHRRGPRLPRHRPVAARPRPPRPAAPPAASGAARVLLLDQEVAGHGLPHVLVPLPRVRGPAREPPLLGRRRSRAASGSSPTSRSSSAGSGRGACPTGRCCGCRWSRPRRWSRSSGRCARSTCSAGTTAAASCRPRGASACRPTRASSSARCSACSVVVRRRRHQRAGRRGRDRGRGLAVVGGLQVPLHGPLLRDVRPQPGLPPDGLRPAGVPHRRRSSGPCSSCWSCSCGGRRLLWRLSRGEDPDPGASERSRRLSWRLRRPRATPVPGA